MSNCLIVRSVLVVLVLVVPASIGFAGDSQISYSLTELGGGSYQYSYDVSNIGLPAPIEEFTIWFDYGLYDDLSVATPLPLANDWDEITIQPEPVLSDDGFYDALTLGLPINVGETAGGFSVNFDWLGTGQPGSQYYEIINTTTFGTIESGYTVPQPATCLLLLSGGVLLRRRKR